MSGRGMEYVQNISFQAQQFVSSPGNHVFPAVALAFAVGCGPVLALKTFSRQNKQNLPPAVPGIPFLGNLIQMTTEKPHHIFTKWSEIYGPIYTIKTGETQQVIITSPELAKEALVTKYGCIANRSTGTNINTLTRNKKLVAVYDYGDRYRTIKKLLMTNLLGQIPQKALRLVREKYLHSSIDSLSDELKSFPGSVGTVNVRKYLNNVLFRLALHQVFGREVKNVFAPELGRMVTEEQMIDTLVHNIMRGAVMIDWRDFFPSLKWIPNKHLENELKEIELKRSTLIKTLIEDHQKLPRESTEESYCDMLFKHSSELTEDEILLGVWEPIIESSDTTMVTSEWAIYELAKHPEIQERLYNEIKSVAGDRMVTEDDLPKLPFLNAVVKETLRRYTPVPILPPRYVSESVELGGYTIPAGFQLIVNIYGVHHDKKIWKDPEVWDPSRMLDNPKVDMGVTDMRAMPFGGGKRICAGMTLAFYIVPMIIASFVQQFEWSLPASSGKGQVEDTLYLTTQKLHPLQAVAKPRKR